MRQALKKALSQAATYLPLHLRPEDPLCHPVFGEKKPAKGLLLKVSRKATDEGFSNNDDLDIEATVVARIDTVVQFSGMADFQYVSHDPRPLEQQVRTTPPPSRGTFTAASSHSKLHPWEH